MANIFANQKEYVEKHKRNTFDLSFTNNLTFDFGDLVPVFCKEVIPGDSFSILPSFGLRLMPLVFPIQTRMNANLHFFYVRNRNLWKDWPDFIGRTKQNLVPPYLNNATNFSTGSLADYLGCPTTLVGNYGNKKPLYSGKRLVDDAVLPNNVSALLPFTSVGSAQAPYSFLLNLDGSLISLSKCLEYTTAIAETVVDGAVQPNPGSRRMFISPAVSFGDLAKSGRSVEFLLSYDVPVSLALVNVCMWVHRNGDWYPDFILSCVRGSRQFTYNTLAIDEVTIGTRTYTSYHFNRGSVDSWRFAKNDLYRFPDAVLNYEQMVEYLSSLGSDQVRFSIASVYFNNTEGEYNSGNLDYIDSSAFPALSTDTFKFMAVRFELSATDGISDIAEFGTLNPYSTHDLKVSALPFRAYESIYNCFYRNQFNDPFILNGQKEYNKFIRSNEGGSDEQKYELQKRNYELDFLTSARQSPVDGDITPLVGVNASGEFTFKNADDTVYTVKPQIGDDGHTLTGIESMEGTPENNSGLRRLVDMISLGISINDFRNVNALQRWLETNLRRGYRYKDQIMSHFGVDISYEELDMPEFIGGMSEPIIVNQINQSVDQTGNPDGLGDFSKVLGSYAGQASIMAQSKHRIKKYCDEHGFIIGILSVSPVPCYSQLLPKYLIKNNVLDYYFPEFGHIGNQPITYREVCPLQAYAAGDSLDDPFGYQRPWYDLLASVDETHSDFRTTLNGFLITRLFDTKPELGKKFIEVDKDAMTNPFSVTDDTQKIIGQLYFEVSAQRPIPKYGIPRLEA